MMINTCRWRMKPTRYHSPPPPRPGGEEEDIRTTKHKDYKILQKQGNIIEANDWQSWRPNKNYSIIQLFIQMAEGSSHPWVKAGELGRTRCVLWINGLYWDSYEGDRTGKLPVVGGARGDTCSVRQQVCYTPINSLNKNCREWCLGALDILPAYLWSP